MVVLSVVSLGAVGCGGNVKEIAPVKAADEKNIGNPQEKAMSGMPEEMRKKYQDKMKK